MYIYNNIYIIIYIYILLLLVLLYIYISIVYIYILLTLNPSELLPFCNQTWLAGQFTIHFDNFPSKKPPFSSGISLPRFITGGYKFIFA